MKLQTLSYPNSLSVILVDFSSIKLNLMKKRTPLIEIQKLEVSSIGNLTYLSNINK